MDDGNGSDPMPGCAFGALEEGGYDGWWCVMRQRLEHRAVMFTPRRIRLFVSQAEGHATIFLEGVTDYGCLLQIDDRTLRHQTFL